MRRTSLIAIGTLALGLLIGRFVPELTADAQPLLAGNTNFINYVLVPGKVTTENRSGTYETVLRMDINSGKTVFPVAELQSNGHLIMSWRELKE